MRNTPRTGFIASRAKKAGYEAFTGVVVLLWFLPFYNERRLIRLVRELETDSASNEPNE